MSTRIIEPPVSTSTPQRKSVTPRRSHPVAIEIPVTVQGSHSAPGRQLPQQFVEETRTVLVFVEGGVLRTSEEVSPGQFLILKNLYNGEETPCVVAPKNMGSAKGYVEVEFAQPVDDFWGIDFATGQPKDALIPPLANEALPAGTKPVASEKIGAVSPIAPAVAPEAAPPSPVDAEMMKRALDAAFSSLPVSSPEPAAVEPSKPRDGVAQSTPVSTWAKPPVWTEAPARPAVAASNYSPQSLAVSPSSIAGSASQGVSSQGSSRALVSLADDIEQSISKTAEPASAVRTASSKAPQFSAAQARKLNPLFDLNSASNAMHPPEAAIAAGFPAHGEIATKRVGARSGWKWMLTGFAVALLCMGAAAGGYRWYIKMPELPKPSQPAAQPLGSFPTGASVSNPADNSNGLLAENATKAAETSAATLVRAAIGRRIRNRRHGFEPGETARSCAHALTVDPREKRRPASPGCQLDACEFSGARYNQRDCGYTYEIDRRHVGIALAGHRRRLGPCSAAHSCCSSACSSAERPAVGSLVAIRAADLSAGSGRTRRRRRSQN